MLMLKNWDHKEPGPKKSNDNLGGSYLRPVMDSVSDNPGAEIAAYGKSKLGVLFLGQGEGDAPTPDFISDAAVKAMREGKTFYGPPLGLPETRQALSGYYKNIYGLDLPANRMVLTPSGTSSVHLALRAVCGMGDEVVAITPLWKNLLCALKLQEVTIREVCVEDRGDRWELDIIRLFEAITPRTKAIIVNSPNNPTGWIMNHKEMMAIMAFARERGIWVLSDEVYSRMTFDTLRAPSFLDIAHPGDRLIVMSSFSKNWAMTGWRLGWMVIPEEAEKGFQDLTSYSYLCPPAFPQYAGIEALTNGEEFLRQQMDWYRQARDMVHDYFDRSEKIRSIRPLSTFYSFLRIEGEEDDTELARKLVDKGSICLAPGSAFGSSGKGYLRFCFAVSENKLSNALERIDNTLKYL